MKILRVGKFEHGKGNERKPATSQTEGEPGSEDSIESESGDGKTGAESADVQPLEQSGNVAGSHRELRDEEPEQPDPGPEESSKGEQQSSTGRLPGDGQKLQTFFENLQYDNPQLWPKGESPDQSLEQHPIEEQIPNSEPLPQDMNLPGNTLPPEPEENPQYSLEYGQPAEPLPSNLQTNEPERTQKSSKTGVIPITGSLSGEKTRSVDLRAVSKPEHQYEEKPRRRQKDFVGGGADITEPPRFSLRDVFHIIFKRKLQVLFSFLVIVSAVVVGTLLMTPVYEASSQILVKLGRESVFVPTTGNVTPILNINREEQVNSEIEILKSRVLAEKVVATIGPSVLYKSLAEEKSGILSRIIPDKRPEMTPDERKAADFESAVTRFMRALEVVGIKKSNVIQVSFKHADPQMAATVVNNLSKLYLDQHLAVHKTPQNVKFFTEQTDLLKSKLDRAEENLEELRKQHNISSLEEQRSLLLNQSSALSSNLNETISQEVETEKRIRQLRIQLADVPETISQGVENDQNPYLMNTLEARLVELQLKEKELLTKYTDQSRLVQNVQEEIRVVQQKLKEQESKSYGSRTLAVNPTHQKLKEELLRNEADLEALKAKKITQREHLNDLQVKLENLNQVESQIKELEQQIEVDRGNFKLYLTKVEESRISDAMDSEKIASVSVIGPARPPREPISPKVMLNILIGIFLGIFGALSLALFREYLDDRIEKIEDVEKELQLPVLASIPIFKQKAAGAGRL